MLLTPLPPEDECKTELSLPVFLTVFITGLFCLISPLPQLVANRSSALLLLTSAFIPPVAGIVLMSCILFRFGGKEIFQIHRLTLKDLFFSLKGTFFIILSYMLVNTLWKKILIAAKIPFEENQQLMIFAQNISGIEFLLLAVLVTIPVPVAEELLFRRVLYGGLVRHGQLTALVFSSLFFAAVHLFLAGVPGLFVIGAGFQMLYLRRKNLLVSILGHSLLNFCAVISALAAKGTTL